MRKYFGWVLVFVFLIILGVVGWYGFGLGRESGKNYLNETGEIEYFDRVEQINSGGKVALTQLVNDFDSSVTYRLLGRFVDDFHQYKNGAMYNYFVLDGDKQERKIKINITDNKMNFGLYDGSFEGESFREIISNDVVIELMKPGELIVIEQRQEFGEFETVIDEYYLEVQKVLGNLVVDIESGKNKYQIPGDFVLAPTFLGVIE